MVKLHIGDMPFPQAYWIFTPKLSSELKELILNQALIGFHLFNKYSRKNFVNL